MAALRRAKLNLDRIHIRVWLYSCFLFSAIMAASLWYMVVAERPIPPVAEKTIGERRHAQFLRLFGYMLSSFLAHVSGTGLKVSLICSWVHVD